MKLFSIFPNKHQYARFFIETSVLTAGAMVTLAYGLHLLR